MRTPIAEKARWVEMLSSPYENPRSSDLPLEIEAKIKARWLMLLSAGTGTLPESGRRAG
jgi:hypothetical protein